MSVPRVWYGHVDELVDAVILLDIGPNGIVRKQYAEAPHGSWRGASMHTQDDQTWHCVGQFLAGDDQTIGARVWIYVRAVKP